MSQSAHLSTSRLCSMTTSESPCATSRCSTPSSSRMSSKCRPVVGSSRIKRRVWRAVTELALSDSDALSLRTGARFRRGGFLAGLARVPERRVAQVTQQLDALRLAAGKLVERLAEPQIAEPHVAEQRELGARCPPAALRCAGVAPGSASGSKWTRASSTVMSSTWWMFFPRHSDVEDVVLVAAAFADRAGHENVGEELHLDLFRAGAVAARAAAVAAVEGKIARAVALRARRVGARRRDRGSRRRRRDKARHWSAACARAAPGRRARPRR